MIVDIIIHLLSVSVIYLYKYISRYYSSFAIYNPYLSELPTSTKERRDNGDYKYFNPDGGFGNYHEKVTLGFYPKTKNKKAHLSKKRFWYWFNDPNTSNLFLFSWSPLRLTNPLWYTELTSLQKILFFFNPLKAKKTINHELNKFYSFR